MLLPNRREQYIHPCS